MEKECQAENLCQISEKRGPGYRKLRKKRKEKIPEKRNFILHVRTHTHTRTSNTLPVCTPYCMAHKEKGVFGQHCHGWQCALPYMHAEHTSVAHLANCFGIIPSCAMVFNVVKGAWFQS